MNQGGVQPVRRRSHLHLGLPIGNYRQRMHQLRQTNRLHHCLDNQIHLQLKSQEQLDRNLAGCQLRYLRNHRHRRQSSVLHPPGKRQHQGW